MAQRLDQCQEAIDVNIDEKRGRIEEGLQREIDHLFEQVESLKKLGDEKYDQVLAACRNPDWQANADWCWTDCKSQVTPCLREDGKVIIAKALRLWEIGKEARAWSKFLTCQCHRDDVKDKLDQAGARMVIEYVDARWGALARALNLGDWNPYDYDH